jgi:hypothetical protein
MKFKHFKKRSKFPACWASIRVVLKKAKNKNARLEIFLGFFLFVKPFPLKISYLIFLLAKGYSTKQ